MYKMIPHLSAINHIYIYIWPRKNVLPL